MSAGVHQSPKVGAAIGGTIGLTAGAFEALEEHEAQIAGCLEQKGYLVAGYLCKIYLFQPP